MWPSLALMARSTMLPEPIKACGSGGGFRQIALPYVMHRLWARARGQLLRQWSLWHPRKWLALGSGKSTVDAASRVLFAGEAANDNGNDGSSR